MREMKESGIDWIGKIPEKWKIGKVKDIFIRKNEKANDENPTVLSLARSGVRIRDISTGKGQLAENYNNYNPVEIGDLLLNPMDLYSGANCSISKVKGVISPAYINLKAKGKNNSIYYDYYFKTQYWGMALFAHGKGVSFDNRWTLGLETALNYFIPIPTELEQNKIATFLDKKIAEIDEIIEKTKETIEDYRRYKYSFISTVIRKRSDRLKIKFKYLMTIMSGSSLTNENLTDNDLYPVYGGGKLIGYTNNYNVEKNNIIIGRVGANCGCITILEDNSWATDNALIVNSQIKNIRYLYYLLINSKLNDLNESNAQPLITATKVLNMYVDYTENEKEQQRIVTYLDKVNLEIEELIKNKEKIIDELEQYKKSLIYEYVTGKKEVI